MYYLVYIEKEKVPILLSHIYFKIFASLLLDNPYASKHANL